MILINQEPHGALVLAEVPTNVMTSNRQEYSDFLPNSGSTDCAVLCGLVQFATENHAARQGAGVITRKVLHRDLTRMVGAFREMISRMLKDLQARGLIQTQADGLLRLRPHLDSWCNRAHWQPAPLAISRLEATAVSFTSRL